MKQQLNKNYKKKIDEHEKKCQKIFREIILGKNVYIRADRIVSKNENGDDVIHPLSKDNNQYIRITLLTDDIITYDSSVFSNGKKSTNLLNEYRPYFVSFVVPIVNDNIDNVDSLGSDWYTGKFDISNNNLSEKTLVLNGILEMSASPINYIEGRLIIFKECTICKSKLDEIYKTYKASDFTCASNTNIESEVNCIWECDFPNTIDIYNVGHGNADYIRGEKHRILYDIGYNYRSFPTRKNCKYLRAVNAIRYLKPSCVILSHWDLDHIIGCAYAEREIFTCKWIAPNLTSSRDNKPSINAVRIAKYLDLLGNLNLVDRE